MNWKMVGVIASILAVVASIHAGVVVPGIMYKVREEMDNEIARHTSHPHPGAVSRDEFHLLISTIESLREDVKELTRMVNAGK